jgi:hypothetical protein
MGNNVVSPGMGGEAAQIFDSKNAVMAMMVFM